jgi:hypothetical protein
MAEMRNAYKILAGKPKGKRPLGRLRRRWEDNIEIDLRERETGRIWPRLANSLWAPLNTAMNFRVP